MQECLGGSRVGLREGAGDSLSLDKAWHGLHYVLTGTVEPDGSQLGKAVLGGREVGEDFSGYGPARLFTVAEVAELAAALGNPEVEHGAARRFDPARMTELEIYPFGWDENSREWIMDAFERLRDFYAGGATARCAVVTCLV